MTNCVMGPNSCGLINAASLAASILTHSKLLSTDAVCKSSRECPCRLYSSLQELYILELDVWFQFLCVLML